MIKIIKDNVYNPRHTRHISFNNQQDDLKVLDLYDGVPVLVEINISDVTIPYSIILFMFDDCSQTGDIVYLGCRIPKEISPMVSDKGYMEIIREQKRCYPRMPFLLAAYDDNELVYIETPFENLNWE